MPSRIAGPWWIHRAWAMLAFASVLAGASTRAADGPSPPDGLPVGPWVLAPSLTMGWSSDSNVFYRPRSAEPSADSVLRVVPEITAQLPFRNSALELGYRRNFVNYRKTPLQEGGFQELEGALRLRFSTHDVLEVTGAHLRGRAEYLRFDSGELVYRGEPYRLNEWGIGLSREALGHRGYVVRLRRTDLNFSENVEAQFFDFRSQAVEAEYREPVGPSVWVVTSVQIDDTEQYCRARTATGDLCPAVGTPFRREWSGTVKYGIRGAAGGQEPYFLRVGRNLRRYEPRPRSESELVGDGLFTLRLAPSTRLHFTANRSIWPSFFLANDFYRSTEVQARLERLGKTSTTWGGSLSLQAVNYPLGRRDRRVRGEAYATLLVRDRAGIRLSLARHRRSSNTAGFDYEGTVFFAGIVLGWF